MVGAAIKSIPVFGWIAAALSALVGVIVHFVSKANEGKKAAQEFYKSLAENAYKPIATIEDLSLKWNALGDDWDAKKKFIEQNKTAFDQLGVAVLDVVDAENLLNKGKDAFVQAQIDKAKAIVLVQQAQKERRYLKKNKNFKRCRKRQANGFKQVHSAQGIMWKLIIRKRMNKNKRLKI